MEKYWRDAILKNIPHGEEGSLTCNEKEAIILTKLLINKGYAVCITGGDLGEDVEVKWIYAGDENNLDWANYERIAFFGIDYLEDYPKALEEGEEDED